MKRLVVSFILLLLVTSLAAAESLTRRSSQEQHDGLKQYYEISDFRLGGRYDLGNPSSWEFGGEGGKTLESLGAGKLRTAYIAVGTPRRNAAGEITNAVLLLPAPAISAARPRSRGRCSSTARSCPRSGSRGRDRPPGPGRRG